MKNRFKLLGFGVAWLLVGSSAALAAESSTTTTEQIHIRPGKTFVISLPENKTTGYSWQIVQPADTSIIQKTQDRFIAPKTNLLGAGGTHTWTFRTRKSGQTSIIFWMAKWWDPTEPITMHRVNVDSGLLPTGEVSLSGTYAGSKTSRLPDVGGRLFMKTPNFGTITIGLPGNILCHASELYRPTKIGEKITAHGSFQNGIFNVCATNSDYLKSVK